MTIKQCCPTRYNTVFVLHPLQTSNSDGPLGAFQLTLNNTLQNIPHLLSVISHPQALSSNSKIIRISKIIFLHKLLYWFHSEVFWKRNSLVSLNGEPLTHDHRSRCVSWYKVLKNEVLSLVQRNYNSVVLNTNSCCWHGLQAKPEITLNILQHNA